MLLSSYSLLIRGLLELFDGPQEPQSDMLITFKSSARVSANMALYVSV